MEKLKKCGPKMPKLKLEQTMWKCIFRDSDVDERETYRHTYRQNKN